MRSFDCTALVLVSVLAGSLPTASYPSTSLPEASGREAADRPGNVSSGGATRAKDFGAVADRASDDTAAIQAALDAAPPGGSVELGVGHAIYGSLYVRKPVLIKGLSRGNPSYITRGPTVGDADYTVRQFTPGKAAFVIVPGGKDFQYYEGSIMASG